MYAGVPGKGAVDAWHLALTTIEQYKLEKEQFAGAVADIMKFFDQIRRRLVYKVAEAAGMPPSILKAYQSYIEGLKVYNGLAGGMGTPYVRRCGIPQGCPFSMMFVALIMRPWIVLMRCILGIQVYILADDVLILATGKTMIGNLAEAINKTHEYLHQMGAKIVLTRVTTSRALPREKNGWNRRGGKESRRK